MPLRAIGYTGYFISGYDHSHKERYQFEVKDYYNHSFIEIQEEVKDIIRHQDLDKRYFVNEPHYSKTALLNARFQAHCNKRSSILYMFKALGVKCYLMFNFLAILTCILVLCIATIMIVSGNEPTILEGTDALFGLTTIFGIPGIWVFWRWTRPSKYENNYGIIYKEN
jgi:hypothetical protein